MRALTDASFVVERGGVVCLLGDNGAGKSTRVKIISAVTQPDGLDVTRRRRARLPPTGRIQRDLAPGR